MVVAGVDVVNVGGVAVAAWCVVGGLASVAGSGEDDAARVFPVVWESASSVAG